MLAVADGFRGPAGAGRFGLLFERLADLIHRMATRRAAGESRVSRSITWADIWDDLVAAAREAEAINLDRADAVLHRPFLDLEGDR